MKDKINLKNYPNKSGHFDSFGGVYVSETLIHPLKELFAAYKKIASDLTASITRATRALNLVFSSLHSSVWPEIDS